MLSESLVDRRPTAEQLPCPENTLLPFAKDAILVDSETGEAQQSEQAGLPHGEAVMDDAAPAQLPEGVAAGGSEQEAGSADAGSGAAGWYMSCWFPQTPTLLYQSCREYVDHAARSCPNGNFLKGVKWSPDGACLLTASDDNCLRLYDLPSDAGTSMPMEGPCDEADSIPVGLRVSEGETIYDYAWYSRMTTADAASCCFASTSRANPIHLWDACSGHMRCTYRAYDDADEITAAYSLAFLPDGSKLFAGYKKCIRIFDVTRPGRDCRKLNTYTKREASLQGIVSCIGFNPQHQQLACGSYGGSVALFDTQAHRMQSLLRGHQGGVTHVLFSQDGNFLYSGARQDPSIICWDVRYAHDAVCRIQRTTAATNQRVYFDIEPGGRFLATGGTDGAVKVFDLQTGMEAQHLQVSTSTVNGCAFHPHLAFLSAATGHRHYPLPALDEDDSSDTEAAKAQTRSHTSPLVRQANKMYVWRLEHTWLQWTHQSIETAEHVAETHDEYGEAQEDHAEPEVEVTEAGIEIAEEGGEVLKRERTGAEGASGGVEEGSPPSVDGELTDTHHVFPGVVSGDACVDDGMLVAGPEADVIVRMDVNYN